LFFLINKRYEEIVKVILSYFIRVYIFNLLYIILNINAYNLEDKKLQLGIIRI